MTLDSILNEVVSKKTTLSRQEARAVAADIYYSGENAKDILASDDMVDKLLNNYRARASANSQSVAANDPTICPICRTSLKPIKLANDKDAVFCQKHFVVFPVRPK